MKIARLIPVLLVLGLAGCAATPAVGPSASPAPSRAPSATPPPTADSAPVLDKIVISTGSVDAFDGEGGSLASFDYFAETVTAVAVLSDLLDFAPTVTTTQGSSDSTGVTQYGWDGLTLIERVVEGEEGRPDSAPLYITVSAPDVRGVALEGPDGVRVGDPFDPLLTLYPDYIDEYTGRDGLTYRAVQVGVVYTPNEAGGTWMARVVATTHGLDALVTDLGAPRVSLIPAS